MWQSIQVFVVQKHVKNGVDDMVKSTSLCGSNFTMSSKNVLKKSNPSKWWKNPRSPPLSQVNHGKSSMVSIGETPVESCFAGRLRQGAARMRPAASLWVSVATCQAGEDQANDGPNVSKCLSGWYMDIWWIYGEYMVNIWWIYGFSINIWWISGLYMVSM